MAINFPDSPLTNDIFTVNGRRYVWDGTKWIGGTPTTQVTVSSDTAPTSANSSVNDLWWNTIEGALYVYYNDGNTSQWVSAAPPGINGTNSVVSVNSPLTYDSVNKIIGISGSPVMNGGLSAVGIGGLANTTSQLTITDTVLATGSGSGTLLDLAQTWNNAAGNPTAIKLNVTNTASGSTSKLMDLQVGGASKFSVDKGGTIVGTGVNINGNVMGGDGQNRLDIGASNSLRLGLCSYGIIGWTNSGSSAHISFNDLYLSRDAANTLAQRNGVNSQVQRWYNTYTDASNFERASISFNRPTTAVFTGSVSNGVIGVAGTTLNVTAITSGVIATGMILNPGATGTIQGYIPSATFNGIIANNTTLTTSSANGTIQAGQIISGSGVTAGTIILSGSGSNWTISSSANVASAVLMTATGGTGGIGTYSLNTSQIVPAGNTITGTRFSDIPYAVFAAESSGTGVPNIGLALSPKGTGAITAQVPDGTVVGGNARGANAIDLSTSRQYASMVASGTNSVAIGSSTTAATSGSTAIGNNTKAEIGTNATAIGNGSYASGGSSVAIGGGQALGAYSVALGVGAKPDKATQIAFACYNAGNQHSLLTLAATTTTSAYTSVEMSLGGGLGVITIPNSTTWIVEIDLVARSTSGTDNGYFKRRLMVKKGTTSASTDFIPSGATPIVVADMGSNAGAPPVGWAVSFTADTTSGVLRVYVTGYSTASIQWVAKVSLVEVGFA